MQEPFSGDTFSNAVYGSAKGTRNNNCYAWAIGHYRTQGNDKLQPGELAGLRGDATDCTTLHKLVLADAKVSGYSIKEIKPCAKCGPQEYQIMAVVDPGDDYHWYRKHKDVLYKIKTPTTLRELATRFKVHPNNVTVPGSKNTNTSDTPIVPGTTVLIKNAGVWSHKRGLISEGPTILDSKGQIIFDPTKAARDYGDLNYTSVCKAYCRSKKPTKKMG